MTQREAKRWACRRVAAILEADTNLLLSELEELSDADADKVYEAIHVLAAELRRRGQ